MSTYAGFTRRPLRGLLIDDDKTFAEDTSRLLEDRLGYRNISITMEQSESPEDAIRLIKQSNKLQPFDLVITDMRFPPVGHPDAPWAKHSQRGRDVMLAALEAKVPVVLGFTAQGSELFREWRTRCREIGVSLYQWHDLIAADEDSITDDIAQMLLESVNSEAIRSTVAVACDMNTPAGPAMFSFLEALGLTPILFDHITKWDSNAGLPDRQMLEELFRKVQAVVVLFSPRNSAQRQVSPTDSSKRVRDSDPESRVQIASGMALALHQTRTILVRLKGIRRSFSLYNYCIELDGTQAVQAELVRRLEATGCRFIRTGTLLPQAASKLTRVAAGPAGAG